MCTCEQYGGPQIKTFFFRHHSKLGLLLAVINPVHTSIFYVLATFDLQHALQLSSVYFQSDG